MFHTQEPLRDEYSLMDIAYIYTWRRVISALILTIANLKFEKYYKP